MCDGCSQWTHARCGGVREAEYLLLTAELTSEWFCPLCIRSKLPNSGLSVLDTNTSTMLLEPQIVEVNTIQTTAKHPGVNETSLQHSDSKDCAKKRSAKNKKYYMKEIEQEFYPKESSDTRKMLR